jgi:hypothetical protein
MRSHEISPKHVFLGIDLGFVGIERQKIVLEISSVALS